MNKKYLIFIFFPPIFQTILFVFVKLLQNNIYNVTLPIDNNIPYISSFVVFYIIWYLLLFLIPIMIYLYDKDRLKEYALVYIICSIISSVIFVLFPTTISRSSYITNSFTDILVKFIYEYDTPALNCFPSLHALESMLWIWYVGCNNKFNKYIRIGVWVTCIGIILSTLFIKQHVIVDIIGSLLVLILGYNISKLILKKLT